MKYFKKEKKGDLVFVLTNIRANRKNEFFFFKNNPGLGVVYHTSACLCTDCLRGNQIVKNLSKEEETEAHHELTKLVEESKEAPKPFVFLVREPEFHVKDGHLGRGIDGELCEYLNTHQWSEELSYSYRSREDAEEALEEYTLRRLKETGLLEEATRKLFKQQG